MSARIAYFHGMPGGPGEWTLFAPPELRDLAVVPDRNGPGDPAKLANMLEGEGWTLIGFSLGAPVALNVAARLGSRAAHVHLVSPAGPLQLGDFLPDMAGGALFNLAARRPRLFAGLANIEGLAARWVPRWLMRRLMAGTCGDDRALARDAAFIAAMGRVLQRGMGENPRGFISEVQAYVADWRAVLPRVTAPVTIWQGDADTWTPPAMARSLQAALPTAAHLITVPGASHYSTLRHALRNLGQQ